MHDFKVIKEKLTDGSHVYNVTVPVDLLLHVPNAGPYKLVIECLDEDQATTIADFMNKNTVNCTLAVTD